MGAATSKKPGLSIILALLACLLNLTTQAAAAKEPWEKGSCRKADMPFPVVDFHTHTFNFRHLPLRGILYGWDVPDLVSSVAAEIFWGLTREFNAEGKDPFPQLRWSKETKGEQAKIQEIMMADAIDWYSAMEDELTDEQKAILANALDDYLVSEIEYEQYQLRANSTASNPISDYFRSIQELPSRSGFNAKSVYADGRQILASAVKAQSFGHRLLALLIKPFDLAADVKAVYRFFTIMIQSELVVAERLFAENCMADYFVHHMMDLEPVYDDQPPVSFNQQLNIVDTVRRLPQTENRLIPFSAFTPFRYDEYELGLVQKSLDMGFLGAKYYPPSGYSASVAQIPKKPSWFRPGKILLLQMGARKQWEARYDPLSEKTVRDNWDVTITDKDRAEEQTLEGVSGKFFNFAAGNKLVIFSHQTPKGFEAYKGYGKQFAQPCDWVPVLNEHEELVLVLGHSGGGSWYSNDSKFEASFSAQAYNLCVTYENVYCDFGYHEKILTDKGKARLQKRLGEMSHIPVNHTGTTLTPQTCRQKLAEPQYSLFDKLVYGSDWMMITNENGYENYLAAFDAVFSSETLKKYRGAFFGGNAVRILNMSVNKSYLAAPLRTVGDKP